LQAADLGTYVQVRRIEKNANGQFAWNYGAYPTPTGSAPPRNVVRPTIAGAGAVGGLLSGSPGSWTGGAPTFLRQWLVCDGDLGCVPIPGETGPTYVPDAADGGYSIRLAVLASDGGALANATVALSLPVAIP